MRPRPRRPLGPDGVPGLSDAGSLFVMARSATQESRRLIRRRLTNGLLVGGVALGAPALVNAIVARRASRLPQPRWGDASQVEIKGRQIAVVRLEPSRPSGKPPVVLLHTFGPGHSGLLWRQVAERLAHDHECFVPDWPGWGESERKRQRHDAALCIEVLDGLLSELPDRPAVLVAPHRTAAYAVEAALARPDAVAALALVGPLGIGGEVTREPGDPVLHSLLRAPVLGKSALNVVISERALENHLRRETLFGPEGVGSSAVQELYRASHLPGASHALIDSLCGQLGHRLPAGFGADVRQPVWLAWGRQATNPPIEAADLWLQELPNAQLDILDGCRNLPHFERSAAFVAALTAFLDRQRFAA